MTVRLESDQTSDGGNHSAATETTSAKRSEQCDSAKRYVPQPRPFMVIVGDRIKGSFRVNPRPLQHRRTSKPSG